MFWFNGDNNWRHNYAGAPQLWWPIGLLFALGIIISFGKIIRNAKIGKNILPEILLFFWLIIGLLPVVVSSESLPHSLRAIIVLPAVTIISAVGLEWLISTLGGEVSNGINRIKKELIIFLIAFFISVIAYSYNQYFLRWANHPDVYGAFNQNYVEIGNYLNSLPKETPNYVIVNAAGVDVRGIPMPIQTVMFITKTYLPKWQKEKNIYYIVPGFGSQASEIKGCAENCVIAMLESDRFLIKEFKEKIPALWIDAGPEFITLKK